MYSLIYNNYRKHPIIGTLIFQFLWYTSYFASSYFSEEITSQSFIFHTIGYIITGILYVLLCLGILHNIQTRNAFASVILRHPTLTIGIFMFIVIVVPEIITRYSLQIHSTHEFLAILSMIFSMEFITYYKGFKNLFSLLRNKE